MRSVARIISGVDRYKLLLEEPSINIRTVSARFASASFTKKRLHNRNQEKVFYLEHNQIRRKVS